MATDTASTGRFGRGIAAVIAVLGLWLSATAAVVAEFVASDRGLGYLLQQYNGNLETPMVFAIIVLLSLIGLAIYYLVELIERLVIPWHVSQRPADVTGI